MGLPSLFKKKWSSCKQPKTQYSFRAGEEMFKIVNSVYFDPTDVVTTPDTWFTNSSESDSLSTVSDDSGEMVDIHGLRSERLFFEAAGETNSILEEAKENGFPFKESIVVAMESEDPYVDFRNSMKEMVEAHGLKEGYLEELLRWYLRVNGKKTHGFIVGAFIDLLLGIEEEEVAEKDEASSCLQI